jgi:hypothetical protein
LPPFFDVVAYFTEMLEAELIRIADIGWEASLLLLLLIWVVYAMSWLGADCGATYDEFLFFLPLTVCPACLVMQKLFAMGQALTFERWQGRVRGRAAMGVPAPHPDHGAASPFLCSRHLGMAAIQFMMLFSSICMALLMLGMLHIDSYGGFSHKKTAVSWAAGVAVVLFTVAVQYRLVIGHTLVLYTIMPYAGGGDLLGVLGEAGSEAEPERLRECFDLFDEDGDGVIDAGDIGRVIHRILQVKAEVKMGAQGANAPMGRGSSRSRNGRESGDVGVVGFGFEDFCTIMKEKIALARQRQSEVLEMHAQSAQPKCEAPEPTGADLASV